MADELKHFIDVVTSRLAVVERHQQVQEVVLTTLLLVAAWPWYRPGKARVKRALRGILDGHVPATVVVSYMESMLTSEVGRAHMARCLAPLKAAVAFEEERKAAEKAATEAAVRKAAPQAA